MNPSQIVAEVKTKLDQSTDHFKDELKKLRTGRAHPAMLDNVMVEAYGQSRPLKSLAGVTTPEPQLLQIMPFDPNNLSAIAEAIRNDQSLGLTPTDDGRVVRVNLPPMTSENRQEMVRLLHQKVEESMISARNARHEAIRKSDQAGKDKQVSKDEQARLQKQIDDLMSAHKTQIDSLAKTKQQEITTI